MAHITLEEGIGVGGRVVSVKGPRASSHQGLRVLLRL